jgi:hypothetical protein
MVHMTQTPSAPDGLPQLSRGAHLSPEAGACFMEYVSVLAGEPWSDQPRCTHPVLAELARMVNDSTSQAGRNRLVPFIPSVIGLTSEDPRTSALLVDRLVTEAERLGVHGPVLHWHQRRAQRRLRRLESQGVGRARGLRGLSAFAYQEGPAMRAVDAVVHAVCGLPGGRRDDGLVALLELAIRTLSEVTSAEVTSRSGVTPGRARLPGRAPTTRR